MVCVDSLRPKFAGWTLAVLHHPLCYLFLSVERMFLGCGHDETWVCHRKGKEGSSVDADKACPEPRPGE